MRFARLFPALLLAAAGCSTGSSVSTPNGPKTGPHGGPAVALPGGQGFAEVVIESEPGGRKGAPPVAAAYFYKDDLKTPLPDAPTSATVKFSQPGGGSAEYALARKPAAKDPAGAGRLASGKPAEAVDPLVGELTVTVGGGPATLAFPAP